jgi:hypothetical protein
MVASGWQAASVPRDRAAWSVLSRAMSTVSSVIEPVVYASKSISTIGRCESSMLSGVL